TSGRSITTRGRMSGVVGDGVSRCLGAGAGGVVGRSSRFGSAGTGGEYGLWVSALPTSGAGGGGGWSGGEGRGAVAGRAARAGGRRRARTRRAVANSRVTPNATRMTNRHSTKPGDMGVFLPGNRANSLYRARDEPGKEKAMPGGAWLLDRAGGSWYG